VFEPLLPNAAPLLAAASGEAEAVSEVINLVPLLLVLPLAGFAFTALFGRRIGRFAFLVPLLLIVATWAIAMVVVYEALTGGFGEHGAGITLWTWIPASTWTS
jgi:ACR3 family arsenite efflux pump ArsB